MTITFKQYQILTRLSDIEHCFGYWAFEDTGMDRKTLKTEVKKLRELGLVEYVRGLL